MNAARTLTETLVEHVRAACTGLWVQSHEHADALAEICRVAAAQPAPWTIALWDCDRGLSVPSFRGRDAERHAGAQGDPLAAIRSLRDLAPEADDGATVLVLPNFHRFLDSAEIVQALAGELFDGRGRRTFVLILSPIVSLPVELERMFVVLDHPLPDAGELEQIALGVAEARDFPPDAADRRRLLDAAAGMTRLEAETAMALSLVRHGRLDVRTIWECKAQMLRRSGLLRLHRGGERFADLGGLEALKAFCRRALAPRAAGAPARPRGVLLLGVPGTGKSALAKALGNETDRPTLALDVGALYGSLVGQTEANVRGALAVADAMAPCVLFIDEIEKALAGAESSGRTDSGVSARLFGTLLTWLSDHESDVFVVATSNDVGRLPPEFSRAERWDGVWFIDQPTLAERRAIWRIHTTAFGLEPTSGEEPDADGWTGAEIKSCCRLASLLGVGLLEAGAYVVPVASTAAEGVRRLREWATGRCLSAASGAIYRHDGGGRETPPAAGPRRVARAARA